MPRPLSNKSPSPSNKKPTPHHQGHRDRLRKKLFESEGRGLHDYELLELLLFSTIPRRDVKPLAKKLLAHYGDFYRMLHAKPETLKSEFNLSDSSIALFKTVQLIALNMGKQQIADQPILNSWAQVISYCQSAMAHKVNEETRILYLNRRNVLIKDEVAHQGTIDHTALYPREILKRALELGAGAIILIHNHPSGDPTPSQADIEITQQIKKATDLFEIHLHDHIIIAANGHVSFKNLGLLDF